MRPIYLDYNATTPLDPGVRTAMEPYWESVWGNPSSVHAIGRVARAALDDCRYRMAAAWKSKPSEVVFTSGGTEANHLAIVGSARLRRSIGWHLVTSSVEHPAVLETFRFLSRHEGFDLTVLPVDAFGQVSCESLIAALRPETTLVSIMTGNNEVGTLQPVAEIGRICRQRGILFHTDAVQAFGKLPFESIHQFEADLVTVCAHKFHGPKGAGALFVRSPLQPLAVLVGGGQENERRAGTENLPAIVGLVEAFRHVADLPAALSYSVNTAGNGFSTPLDLRAWSTGGAPRGMHYTQIPTIFGRRADGTPDVREDNRYDVFLRETRNESVPGWGDPSFTNVTTDGHLLVPYRFDSDERAGLVWQDQTNDAGADAYESMHYVAGRWLDYYFANSFSRLRSGFSTDAYVSRMWGRYVEQLRQSSQTLSFDLVTFQDFLGNAPDWRRYRDDPTFLGGFVNQAATSVVADAFVAMMTMPEIGAHRIVARDDGQRLAMLNLETGAGFPVPINQGRAFESDWRNDAGFWWYEQLNRAGSYYDKVMAIDAFTDPELLLLQRDTPADLRLFQLSFYSMYPAQTIRLWGGLLAEDYADFAPVVETGGTRSITRTHLATLNLPPGDGVGHSGRVVDDLHLPIDPQAGFTVQLRAAVMGVANIPATFDQRFMDFARVWTDGSVEAITVADPTRDTVSFTDPWSRTTYRALHFGTRAGEPGADVGASMLVHAATGAAADEAGVGARMVLRLRDLDALRLRAQAAGEDARAAVLETQLRQYIDLVHVLRRLTSRFGTGTSVTR